MKSTGSTLAFFRQSGWLVVATVLGGVFMSAVHVVVSKPMKASEYAVFYALLQVFLLMGFPAGGIQVMFAKQAAAAISETEKRRLSQAARTVLRATFLIWLVMAAAVFVWRDAITVMLKIANPAALWVTVLLGLASLWAPLFKGILQGRQNFAGLGWVMILDGVGRFTAIVLIVQLGGQAAGGMTGALIGQIVSLALGAWLVRSIIAGPGAAFEWRPWFHEVIPLTLGVGVVLYLCTAHVIYIQTVFSKEESPFYAPAAMIGLAMIAFTTPLASVMFPKVVHSAARIEKTDAVRHALAATTLLGGAAALACTVLPQLPLRIIYFRSPKFWVSAPLIPWFAWCLLPLIVGNVLVSNLLARQRFRIVPWLVMTGLGYGAVLFALKDRLVQFSLEDLRDASALTQRVQSRRDPVARLVWEHLPAEKQVLLSQASPDPVQSKLAVVQALNELLNGTSLFDAERFAGVNLSKEAQKLILEGPHGKELIRLNRLLLHAAFPSELAPIMDRLFRAFKMVIGTLGVFSAVLLLVAMWSTFRNPATEKRSQLAP